MKDQPILQTNAIYVSSFANFLCLVWLRGDNPLMAACRLFCHGSIPGSSEVELLVTKLKRTESSVTSEAGATGNTMLTLKAPSKICSRRHSKFFLFIFQTKNKS